MGNGVGENIWQSGEFVGGSWIGFTEVALVGSKMRWRVKLEDHV